MVDRSKSAGSKRAKSGTRLEPVPTESTENYKRLEELKEIMGQRHGKSKKAEEVKLFT